MAGILACLGMILIILAVICFTPKWFKIIFFVAFIGWILEGKWGWGVIVGIIVTVIGILVSLFWSGKEEKRHHSEEGTKFWE